MYFCFFKKFFSSLNAFPCLSKYSLSDCYSYVGLRPATTVDDYILQFDRETNCGMVASIRSTGLTACLGKNTEFGFVFVAVLFLFNVCRNCRLYDSKNV